MSDCPTCGTKTGDGILWGFDSRILAKDGVVIHLSLYEAEILRLLKDSDAPVTGNALDWAIFKSLSVNASQIIKVTLCRLRRKIAPFGIEIVCAGATRNGRQNTLYSLKT